MKFYLSSYRIGNKGDELIKMVPLRKIGYIRNASDKLSVERNMSQTESNINELKKLGLEPEIIDLKNYFGKYKELEEKLNELNAVWIKGGNTFVLRQAMKLSGFDKYILSNLHKDFLYAGYSAAICVLYKNMYALQIVDDPNEFPYKEINETIWEGLGIVDHMLLPHYDSDHPESEDISKEVEYCKKNNIPYKTLRDGEVIILNINN